MDDNLINLIQDIPETRVEERNGARAANVTHHISLITLLSQIKYLTLSPLELVSIWEYGVAIGALMNPL